jgi:TRAP-type C4-dicarboxylate transport system permease small subunit
MSASSRNGIAQFSCWFGLLENWLIALLVIFLVLFSLLQIVLRNFFSTGIIWGDTLLRHLVLWVGLLGAARATAEHKHIQVNLLSKLLSVKNARILGIISDLFAMVVTATLLYASITFIGNEMDSGVMAFGDIPNWWLETAFPLGFALMVIRLGYQLVEVLIANRGDLRT